MHSIEWQMTKGWFLVFVFHHFQSKQSLKDAHSSKVIKGVHSGHVSDKDVLESAGTSDPYVVMQIGDCVVKSKTVWATKEL